MSNAFAMGRQLAAHAMRFGVFYGINRLVERRTRALGQVPRYKPRRPVPSRDELMGAIANMLLADAEAVRRGDCPPAEVEPGGAPQVVARVREMLADLPGAVARRACAAWRSGKPRCPASSSTGPTASCRRAR